MKHTLALARVARDDVRAAHAQSIKKLDAARAELTTILRRGDLARQINDTETVAVAERFAESQRGTIAVFERKVAVQHEELELSDRTVNEMEAELRAVTGIGPSPASSASSASSGNADATGGPTADPSDYRGLDDAARAQTADERLAELKRRMGRA